MSDILGRKPTDPLDEFTIVSAFSDQDLRVDLREKVLPCGHSLSWVVLCYYSPITHEWFNVGLLQVVDLERFIKLLQEADAYSKDL